ncbi:MAG: PAS domain S-box protein, partial [Bacteroidales bacterium]|nr:PAS domain S-box protein [Bacteroidales bacterium]
MCLKLHSSVAYESSDIDRNGKIIWLQTTLTPIFDSQGGLKKIVIIESDITRLKQVEARLSELNWHLERKIEEEVQKNRQKDLLLAQQSRLAAMGEMISNIAHQWRQPLNAIGIIVQNIEDTYVYGEMTPEYIGKKV